MNECEEDDVQFFESGEDSTEAFEPSEEEGKPNPRKFRRKTSERGFRSLLQHGYPYTFGPVSRCT